MTKRVPRRAWQRMLSGRRLDLLDPSPLDIEIVDIAHGLARVARWNGQTRGPHPFSVAQHSLLVERILRHLDEATDPSICLAALLHDAPEYVIGDVISPFKAIIGEAYRGVEDRLTEAIHLRYGLPPRLPGPQKAIIKRADTIAAYYEATELADFSPAEARRYFGDPQVDGSAILPDLSPMPVTDAQSLFLERFRAIESTL